MTEAEAKTKWCPFVRYTSPTDTQRAYSNRPDGTDDESLCIASECMAWRTTPEVTETRDMDYGTFPRGEEGWVNLGTSPDWHGLRYARRTGAQGFCGLAGALS